MAAFNYRFFQRWSAGFDLSNNNEWNYCDASTSTATISAAGFFNLVNPNANAPQLSTNDLMWIEASDSVGWWIVTATSPNVTIIPYSSTIGPGTPMFVNVAETSAQWKAQYATPFLLIASPGAGKMIMVVDWFIAMTYGTAQYTAGGESGLQYGNTNHAGGNAASQVISANTVNNWAVSSGASQLGVAGAAALTASVNQGLYISNDTAAFATGDSNFNHLIWYSVVPVPS